MLRELRNKNIITYTTSLYLITAIVEACLQNGIALDTRLSSPDTAMLTELLETGHFAVFDGNFLGDSFVRLEIEDLDIHMELYLIVNKNAFINRAVETFIEYAKEKLGEG